MRNFKGIHEDTLKPIAAILLSAVIAVLIGLAFG